MEQKRTKIQQIIIAVVCTAFLIVLDQFTKYLAVIKLKGQPAFPIIPDVFQLTYVENRGAAFGMLQGKKLLFLVLTTVFLALLCYCYTRMLGRKRFRPLRVISMFLFAGAVGNLIDRVWHNYVVDFFYFELIDFPVFNVADIYITVTCIVFFIMFIFFYKEEDFTDFFPKKKKDR